MAKIEKSRIDNNEMIPATVLAEMLMALPVKSPPAQRKSAMLATLKKNVAASDRAKPVVVKAGEGKWINFAPSVDMKILHVADGTRSWLARFGPGGCVPAHIQSGDEEAIILSGWCYLDEEKLSAGDYHRIGKDERHGNILSPEGCLIFVRSHSVKQHASQLVSAS